MKRVVSIITALLLLPPVLLLAWLSNSQSGLNWAFEQVRPVLPGEVSFSSLQGRLIGPITLKDMQYQYNGTQVQIDQAKLDWQPFALLTTGINVTMLDLKTVDVTLTETKQTTATITLPELHLPWPVTLNNATINTLNIQRGEQQFALHDVSLNARTLFSQIEIKQFSAAGEGFDLKLKGELEAKHHYQHAFETEWQYQNSDHQTINGRGRLVGDLKKTQLDQQLSGALQLTLEGEIKQLLTQPSWLATVKTGKTKLQARGEWLQGDASIALHWHNLHWPLTGTPWFNSASGSGWITGTPEHYQAALASDRPWAEAPASTWYASVDGNRSGLDFHSLRLATLEGEILTKGKLQWSPQFTWQAEVTADNINPSAQWPEWPGRLNAELTSSGGIENGEFYTTADISQLDGELLGYAVDIQSQLGWHKQGLDIERFDFKSASSQLHLKGRIADELNLVWRIQAGNLAELYPHAGGRLHGKGSFTGPRSKPIVRANLKGQALRLNDYRLKSLVIDSDGETVDAKAVADKLSAELRLKGETDTQGWRGRIERATVNSEQFQNWQLQSPAALEITRARVLIALSCWLSNESRLCISTDLQAKSWQASAKAEKLPLPLLAPWLPPDLKLEGTADAEAELTSQADIATGFANLSLPAGAISYPLLKGDRDRWDYEGGTVTIRVDEQGINAQSELAVSQQDRLKAKLELPGAKLFTPLDRQQQPLRGEAKLTIHDPALIGALIPEVERLQGQLTLNLAAGGTLGQPRISGKAQLNNGSLLVPRLGLSIDQITFQAQSDALEKASFSLGAHSGEGRLSINGETILDRAAGWPTSINIKGDSFEASHIPEARVLVSPDLKVAVQRRSIKITGDVHIPYAKLQPKDITTAATVSEDVVIVGTEEPPTEKWNIYTDVRVTLGERVSFYGFGFEGLLGGNLLLHDEPGQLTTATGELTVIEGRYRAYGQRLDVEQGRLLYTGGPITNPGLDLRAARHVGNVTAGLKVWGSLNQPRVELYSVPAMGQTNALSYLLLGRPIENASGEDGAMMAQAALALGLTGGDRIARSLGDRFGLDEMRIETSDTGEQASLVMGRYLSPKLYISYGVGLIEAFNTFTVRYQISDKWQLKGESGEYQGADLLYTIER